MSDEVTDAMLEDLVFADYDAMSGREMVELVIRKEHLDMLLSGLSNVEVFPIPYNPEHSMPSFGIRPKNMKGGRP